MFEWHTLLRSYGVDPSCFTSIIGPKIYFFTLPFSRFLSQLNRNTTNMHVHIEDYK